MFTYFFKYTNKIYIFNFFLSYESKRFKILHEIFVEKKKKICFTINIFFQNILIISITKFLSVSPPLKSFVFTNLPEKLHVSLQMK